LSLLAETLRKWDHELHAWLLKPSEAKAKRHTSKYASHFRFVASRSALI
jgi:hypothetical protein